MESIHWKLKLRGPFGAALFQLATPMHLRLSDPESKQATSDKHVVQQPHDWKEKDTKNQNTKQWL